MQVWIYDKKKTRRVDNKKRQKIRSIIITIVFRRLIEEMDNFETIRWRLEHEQHE